MAEKCAVCRLSIMGAAVYRGNKEAAHRYRAECVLALRAEITRLRTPMECGHVEANRGEDGACVVCAQLTLRGEQAISFVYDSWYIKEYPTDPTVIDLADLLHHWRTDGPDWCRED